MKLIYKDMGHIISWSGGYVCELIVENKNLFFEMVRNLTVQSEGENGDFILSVKDKPVEFSRYAEVNVQFAPFIVNRKSLLTRLCGKLEKNALSAEFYVKATDLLCELEKLVFQISEELPFEIRCKNLTVGNIIRAVAPEIEEEDKNAVEKIFEYMELVRELDRDRLFVMVNMRSYFDDCDMEKFAESVCLHDFKVLLLENCSFQKLKHTRRYTVDSDLCEF